MKSLIPVGWQKKTIGALAIGFSTMVLWLLIRRLFFGVDLTDESFYSALSKSFAEGRHPFIDELLIVQSFAVLLIPITKIFLYFSANGEGIIVFFRLLYFFTLAINCIFAFKFLRSKMLAPEALFTCMILLSFWPFSIPSMSYNTMGALFLNFGLLLLLAQEEKRKLDWRLSVSLLFFVLAIFCYPTFLLPVLITIGVFMASVRNYQVSKTSIVSALAVGGLSFIIAGYLIFFYIGLPRLHEMYEYLKSFGVQGGGVSKLWKISTQIADNSVFIAMIVGGIWTTLFVAKRRIYAGFAICLFLGERKIFCVNQQFFV
ncbi:MAG: hypothetical protein HC883_02585 [Bdellovibrionaceae bacterium]|nr:hypothetical protein [Pseudobdellovibrionaceae bacterium]